MRARRRRAERLCAYGALVALRAARSTRKLDGMDTSASEFDGLGFTVIPDLIDDESCSEVASKLDARNHGGAGSRRLCDEPWCAELAIQLKRTPVLKSLLPPDPVAAQCTLFEKTPQNNWLVALHQDLSIPVRERVPSLACSGWSEKEGTLFVQPRTPLLEQLVAVRLHIDPCLVENGPLRVVPRSHRFGRLLQTQFQALRLQFGERQVAAPRRAALLLRPLLLHASSKVAGNGTRRILHFLFGPRVLPEGLVWQHAI